MTVAAAAILMIVHFVRARDLARAWTLVRQVGWPLAFVMLPTLAALSLDAAGWRFILKMLGYVVPWHRMLELRVSVEALVLALPGGAVAGEIAKVALLSKRAEVPLTGAGASLALTKACLFTTDAIYLALAAGWATAGTLAGRGPVPAWPVALALGGALLTAVVGIGMFALLREASLTTRFTRLVGRLPIVRLRRWIAARQSGFVTIDEAAHGFFAARTLHRARCLGAFALEWLVEGVETVLILRLLGVSLAVGEIFLLDALGSLVRALIFFAPAGLGVQDTATILLLRAFGVPDPVAVGAAYIVIKRTKEVFWVAAGSLFLAGRRDLWRRADAGSP